MSDEVDLLNMVQTALGTFEYRQSFSPGMFEPLKPLLKNLGYKSAAVYIADDYPDRMQLVTGYGDGQFPSFVAINRRKSLYDELLDQVSDVPGVMTARLFSHGRELGALAVTVANADSGRARDALMVLSHTMSLMAYIERIRTNDRRERQEREVFFAQSLTNRLLIREAPKVKGLRLGFEFIRSLEAGGDFFDFVPTRSGLMGIIGCCNGKGLRTVLEVTNIMREIYRAYHAAESLADILLHVNDLLVRVKRRAHQASLCLFEIDVSRHSLRLAKAGRLGLLLCGPGSKLNNISAPGGPFLGMDAKPKIKDEAYPFGHGHSLFCVTEGIYSSRNVMNVAPQLHWFLRAVETTLESKRKVSLAKAIFDNLDATVDNATRPADSMLALSVEFTGK